MRRKGDKRQIRNADLFADHLKKMRTDLEFVDIYFEGTNISYQVVLLSQARIFVSIHGSGLANLVWMHHGGTVIEISPPMFEHDWFEKAADDVGVKYYKFEADGTEDSEMLRECKSRGVNRKKQPCSDILRDQNVEIDIERFDRELQRVIQSS